MRARRAAVLLAGVLLLPGCIAMFGVEGEGLPKRIDRLEKRIEKLEKARGMRGGMIIMGETPELEGAIEAEEGE